MALLSSLASHRRLTFFLMNSAISWCMMAFSATLRLTLCLVRQGHGDGETRLTVHQGDPAPTDR